MHNDIALCREARIEVSQDRFREAMSTVPSAVHIVTSDGVAGRCGMTATAVLSVSDDPPTVLISINRSSVSAQRLLANKVFCVNTLGAADRLLAEVFAGRTALQRDERFTLGDWEELATGAPVLASARAVFDCRLSTSSHAATHHILIGEVLAMRCAAPGDASLVYLQRDFKAV